MTNAHKSRAASRSGGSNTGSRSTSIHPFGRRSGHNVSKPKSQAVIARVRAALQAHLERHPRDAVSAGHLAKLGA